MLRLKFAVAAVGDRDIVAAHRQRRSRQAGDPSPAAGSYVSPPCEKVTVPVGVPEPGATAATVAVKVTRLAENCSG